MKRQCAWKSPHARKARRGAEREKWRTSFIFSLTVASRLSRLGWLLRALAFRSLDIPEEKWGLLWRSLRCGYNIRYCMDSPLATMNYSPFIFWNIKNNRFPPIQRQGQHPASGLKKKTKTSWLKLWTCSNKSIDWNNQTLRQAKKIRVQQAKFVFAFNFKNTYSTNYAQYT